MTRSSDPGGRKSATRRAALVELAGRLLDEGGADDPEHARAKAATRLRVRPPELRRLGVSASEITDALAARQRLFGGTGHRARLAELRAIAAEAMAFLSQFRPRLTGPVLDGSAAHHSAVELHLFADAPEDVLRFLIDQKLPHEETQARVCLAANERVLLPAFSLLVDESEVLLVVVSGRYRTRPPLDPLDLRPVPRASRSALSAAAGPASASACC